MTRGRAKGWAVRLVGMGSSSEECKGWVEKGGGSKKGWGLNAIDSTTGTRGFLLVFSYVYRTGENRQNWHSFSSVSEMKQISHTHLLHHLAVSKQLQRRIFADLILVGNGRLGITIDLAQNYFAGLRKVFLHTLRCLVEDGSQHIAKPTPANVQTPACKITSRNWHGRVRPQEACLKLQLDLPIMPLRILKNITDETLISTWFLLKHFTNNWKNSFITIKN